MTKEDSRSILKNVFIHFQSVFQEFEVPDEYSPRFLDTLATVFEQAHCEAEEKSLIWNGEIDTELSDVILSCLKGQGMEVRK